ncbi:MULTISPECIES: helix-turn-helix domain-containing protein [unclassified Frankia]|uniref:helix-turn-helix domain-containing protein n=1 Tax=unclassified Frankia TaxID=2632575 RepID=UPI001EF5095C|nr:MULTISPECIES: helix-turn-helix domain-containing protein [unclassified Frankia]
MCTIVLREVVRDRAQAAPGRLGSAADTGQGCPWAARAFGLGRTLAYELARRGGFPCEVHRIGRLYRVNTSDLLRTPA